MQVDVPYGTQTRRVAVPDYARVYLHSSRSEQSVTDALVIPARHLQETVNILLATKGPASSVAVLPEGPMTVMHMQ
jgi:hypothetical protein